jgi:RloB-like protein
MEGKNTEPDYFKAMRTHYRGALIDLELVEAAGTPLTIAQKAVEAKRAIRRSAKGQSWQLEDQVWAIFDQDLHPHVAQALGICANADIGIAYSNPCFELWLILHLEDFGRQDGHKAVQKHLDAICEKYDSDGDKRLDCSPLMECVEQAEERARRQCAQREAVGDPRGRPVTTVFRLTAAIREEVMRKR